MRLCRFGLFNLLILFALFVACGINPAMAKAKKGSGTNQKYASIVIDADTGAILSQSNPDKILHPASLTKMMTLSLTFEAIQSGRLSPNQRIRISPRAAAQSPSKLGLAAGQTITVQDAIYAVVTKSANDISVALAEAVGGSETQFVQMMNARAKTIGMNRTVFRNASGLPDSRQVSTARDMAKLGRHIIHNQPRYYPIFNKRSFTYNGHTYRNHNRLLDSYPGLDGMTTGFVNAAGFNLVASAKRNGQRIIGVVFGGQSTQSRNIHMASLLDGGFVSMDKIRIAQANTKQGTSELASVRDMGRRLSFTSTAYAAADASEETGYAPAGDLVQKIAPQAGVQTFAAQPLSPQTLPVPAPTLTAQDAQPLQEQDRLIQTVPVIASMTGQPQPAPTRIETVKVASLSTAADVQTDASSQAIAPTQPIYIPRRNLGAGVAVNEASGWSVQVGAFQSRVATDQALYKAMNKLPAPLNSRATAMIVPLRTADANWVFRARLSGFTQAEAQQACSHLQDCLTISPQAN